MLTCSGLLIGFAFAAESADETTTYIVNVCGHDSVGLPLARNMDAGTADYVEHHGIDNLIVPISVSEPQRTRSPEYAFCVDVVVHTLLIKKCTRGHHLFEHLTEKLLRLALEWIQTECGVQLLSRTCRLVGNPFYFAERSDAPKSVSDFMKLAADVLQKKSEVATAASTVQDPIPDALNLAKSEAPTRRQPLIQEVVSTPGIRKGFLTGGGARLYGPEGSKEGTGKAPDPLAHIPQSLRDKCRVIDTRNLGELGGVSAPASMDPSASKAALSAARTQAPAASLASRWSDCSFEQKDGKIVARFAVPDSFTSLHDVELSATRDALEIDGTVTRLPVPIVTDDVKARFVKSTRSLVVTCVIDVS